MERFEFRVWLDNLQKMFYSYEYGSLIPFFLDISPLDTKDVLMQCTGQKDSDGKLIFEGDRVRVYNDIHDLGVYTVVFRGMGFWFVDEENERFVFTTPVYHLRVIGNIYEQNIRQS